MGFGRGCFITIFPMLFTVATIVLAIITFFGCYEHAWGLRDIYYMKLDFSGISVDGISLASMTEEAGLYPIYQIGSNGYCYGTKSANGSTSIKGCKTPMEPFWFDIVTFAESQSTVIASVLKYVDLPSEVTEYESILKSASIAMWALWIATMGLSAIQIIIGFLAFRSRGASFASAFVSVLSFLSSLVAAGIATGIYSIYESKFNDYVKKYGVSASIGSSGLGLAWATVAVCLIAGVSWILSICVGSTSHRHERLPDYDDEKAFIRYVPEH